MLNFSNNIILCVASLTFTMTIVTKYVVNIEPPNMKQKASLTKYWYLIYNEVFRLNFKIFNMAWRLIHDVTLLSPLNKENTICGPPNKVVIVVIHTLTLALGIWMEWCSQDYSLKHCSSWHNSVKILFVEILFIICILTLCNIHTRINLLLLPYFRFMKVRWSTPMSFIKYRN